MEVTRTTVFPATILAEVRVTTDEELDWADKEFTNVIAVAPLIGVRVGVLVGV
jgi:hypothetical protein